MTRPAPYVVCLNDQCPDLHRAKANDDNIDPAGIICGTCHQPVNVATSQPLPGQESTP